MLDYLVNNQIIIDLYNEVEVFENSDKNGYGYHNLRHAYNVAKMVTVILTYLNFSEKEIEDFQLAAMLHDIGAYCGKEGHQLRSYEMTKKMLSDKLFVAHNKDRVLNAILNHSDSFDNDDLGIVALIFADKIDMTKDRVAPAGRIVEGIREFLHLDSVSVDITDSSFNIYFESDGNCNMKELNNYYFIPKMFKAIEAIANRLNLKHNIYFDKNIWVYKYE